MPHGHRTPIRSHRGRGTRRRRVIAPWVVLALVTVIATSGLSAGYVYLVRETCSGEVRATVMAAPGVATLLEGLARTWSDTEPAVGGRCAIVEVETRDSAVLAQQLGSEWDDKGGDPPDVWVPESGAWMQRASSAPLAAKMMPGEQPSIARSPTVLAMPKPMAEALGWPNTQLGWQDLVNEGHAAAAGWGTVGQAEWGEFRLGMTDPLRSTAGLHALLAILDPDQDGEVSSAEQRNVARLRQLQKVYEDSGNRLFAALRREDGQSRDAALRYVSAFPALEQEVLTYNAANPRVPLVAVYPSDGSADADHPYLILNARWSDPRRQEVAQHFLDYLRGPAARADLLAAGLRDGERVAGRDLVEANGAVPSPTTPPRAALRPDSVKRSLELWTALTRAANVLFVLDVSGSMGESVPGTGRTRLGLLTDATRDTVALMSDDTYVGLWFFATRLDGSRDYRQAVPMGRLADPAGGARSRREALAGALDKASSGGNTGLYDTAVAAQKAVTDGFREGATNMVVLVTDGENDDDTGGLDLDQVRQALAKGDPARRVPVVTVGLGPDVDLVALREISRATGTVSYQSTGADLESVLLTAVLGRV